MTVYVQRKRYRVPPCFTTSTQTAAVHYDGATDCDLESTVTWTLDGAGQGEISGISCASVSNRLGWVGMLFSLFCRALGAAKPLIQPGSFVTPAIGGVTVWSRPDSARLDPRVSKSTIW